MLIDERVFKALAGGVKQSTWDKWENAKKKDYIAKHPNSKYAKKEGNGSASSKKGGKFGLLYRNYHDAMYYMIGANTEDKQQDLFKRMKSIEHGADKGYYGEGDDFDQDTYYMDIDDVIDSADFFLSELDWRNNLDEKNKTYTDEKEGLIHYIDLGDLF